MTTVIANNKIHRFDGAQVIANELWLDQQDAFDIAGETVAIGAVNGTPEEPVNLSVYSHKAQRPLLSDAAGETWVLGASANSRAQALQSLQAPDFTLSDLSGRQQSLSDFKGKKVFLVSWASW
ncbi:MAG: hypothetical protein WA888_08190 [Burkholderiaceae bacterium]